jgi:hypothetical protein
MWEELRLLSRYIFPLEVLVGYSQRAAACGHKHNHASNGHGKHGCIHQWTGVASPPNMDVVIGLTA